MHNTPDKQAKEQSKAKPSKNTGHTQNALVQRKKKEEEEAPAREQGEAPVEYKSIGKLWLAFVYLAEESSGWIPIHMFEVVARFISVILSLPTSFPYTHLYIPINSV